jgi:hypothetical protein
MKGAYILPSLRLARTVRMHIQIHRLMGGTSKYDVEMGLGSTIYESIPSSIKTGSGIQKLIGEIHRYTIWRSHKSISIS